MNYCSFCSKNFIDLLEHNDSKIHKDNVLKSRIIRSTFPDYKNYIKKRSIPTEEYKIILSLGKLELSDPDFKELEEYLSTRRNRSGGEKNEKYRRNKIKAFS